MVKEGVIVKEKRGRKKKEEKKELAPEVRMAICASCPIYLEGSGVCDPGRWLNPMTKQTSRVAVDGYYKGCGCLIKRKAHNPSAHCNAGLW